MTKLNDITPREYMQTNDYQFKHAKIQTEINSTCFKVNSKRFEKTVSERKEIRLAKHIHNSEMWNMNINPKKQMNIKIDDIILINLSKKYKS